MDEHTAGAEDGAGHRPHPLSGCRTGISVLVFEADGKERSSALRGGREETVTGIFFFFFFRVVERD